MVYLPRAFAEDRRAVLVDTMRRHAFATLVTHGEGGLIASQLPFLYDAPREEAGEGTLLCHLARPNPQVAQLEKGGEALVIFAGPHAYVSPTWYETRPAVPTWNYASVHAYGIPSRIEDGPALTALLERLSDVYEEGRKPRWRIDDEPAPYIDGMQRAIVGFAIRVTRLEGKFKLSQNRSAADRRRVAAALAAGDDPDSRAVAAMMAAREG